MFEAKIYKDNQEPPKNVIWHKISDVGQDLGYYKNTNNKWNKIDINEGELIRHIRYDWVSGASYGKEDIVFHKGSSYIALSDNPSTEPSFTYDPATGSYNVSAGWGLLAVGADIVQETGDSQDKVMSQKAVTDALTASDQKLSELESRIDGVKKYDSQYHIFKNSNVLENYILELYLFDQYKTQNTFVCGYNGSRITITEKQSSSTLNAASVEFDLNKYGIYHLSGYYGDWKNKTIGFILINTIGISTITPSYNNELKNDIFNLEFYPTLSYYLNYQNLLPLPEYGNYTFFNNLPLVDKYIKCYAEIYNDHKIDLDIVKSSDSISIIIKQIDSNDIVKSSKTIIEPIPLSESIKNYEVQLLNGKVELIVDLSALINISSSYQIKSSVKNTVRVTQNKQYPFKRGAQLNLTKVRGIKDVYIKDYDSNKHYIISRISVANTKDTYQFQIGYATSFNEVTANDITPLHTWILNKSDYSSNALKKDLLLNSSSAKMLINLQELIDEGCEFSAYGTDLNHFSDPNWIDLDLTSSPSKIKLNEVAEDADSAIKQIKTINGHSLVGTGNLVIESGASNWNDIQGKPNFAAVATSGSYNDLSDRPTIEEGTIIIDNILDQSSPNPISNLGVTSGINQRWIIVSTIAQLKSAFVSGYKRIILDTGGSFIELSEQLTIPQNTVISAYNGKIKRATGYDDWLIVLSYGAQIYGLTIDGNKDNVNKTPHDPSIPLWSQVVEIRTSDAQRGSFTNLGNVIKDCKIVNGNTGIMYIGWHHTVENCIFEEMASAGVHYSSCYHSSVKGCTFKNCCLESEVYQHSEGAILWSNYTEGSLIENNYIDGCNEFGIGANDSADNNNIIIQNNRINNTKGIGGVFGGTGSYNVVIKNNFITNCKYISSTVTYGIYIFRSYAAQVKDLMAYNYIIEGNVVWGGGIQLFLNNSQVLNNTIINYKNSYDTPFRMVLDNCLVKGNTFVEGNTEGNNFFYFTLRNSIFESNKVSAPKRSLWLDATERSIFRDNIFQSQWGDLYSNKSNNYGIDFINNTICKGSIGSNVFNVPDFSKILNNTFLGRTDDTNPVLSVSSTSKNVIVKDNRYVGSILLEGTTENGCHVNDNNPIVGDTSKILTEHLFSLSNLLGSIQWSAPLVIGLPIIVKLTPTSGYKLPETITVQYVENGNTITLTPGLVDNYHIQTSDTLKWFVLNNYYYDSDTGYIYIPYVYSGLKVIASGVVE